MSVSRQLMIPTYGGFIAPPAGWTWNLPFRVKRKGSQFQAYGFDVAQLAPTGAGVYYVDQDAGSDAWPGTAEQPLKKVATAQAKADVIYVKPGLYTRTNGPAGTNMTRSVAIYPWPGQAGTLIMSGHQDGLSWTLDGTYTNTYKTTRSAVSRVLDASIVDGNGDYTDLTKRASAAEVDANPNSWYLDGSNVLWVRTQDDREPDADIWPMISNGIRGTGDITIYVQDAHIYGGGYPVWLANGGAGQSPVLALKNCTMAYGTYNGVYGEGVTAYLQNCVAAKNWGDGFNYHILNSVVPKAVEINCVGRHNGEATGVGNDNGSAMHDGGSVCRLNGNYHDNIGPNVIDIDSALAWCLGCQANDSASDYAGGDVGFSVNGSMWLHNCVATGNAADLSTAAASTIYVRNCTYGTTGGLGTVTPY